MTQPGPDGAITYRRARPEDNRAMHDVFLESISEVDRRLGSVEAVDPSDPAVREESWQRWRSLFEHLRATADLAWIAEGDVGVVGYARSISRDGVRELTEFFVLPGRQGHGIGRELLARAFPSEGARHRTIVATLELAALGRYLRAGLLARCLALYVSATPRANPIESDLTAEPLSVDALSLIAPIDRRLIGQTREVDHRWLLGGRDGFLFRRGGAVVGYGYVGARSGPVAVLDPADTPAVLAHLETAAAASGTKEIAFYLPSVNREAIDYFLGRGFRIDPFIATFFSDDPDIALDRYLITSPPFFM